MCMHNPESKYKASKDIGWLPCNVYGWHDQRPVLLTMAHVGHCWPCVRSEGTNVDRCRAHPPLWMGFSATPPENPGT